MYVGDCGFLLSMQKNMYSSGVSELWLLKNVLFRDFFFFFKECTVSNTPDYVLFGGNIKFKMNVEQWEQCTKQIILIVGEIMLLVSGSLCMAWIPFCVNMQASQLIINSTFENFSHTWVLTSRGGLSQCSHCDPLHPHCSNSTSAIATTKVPEIHGLLMVANLKSQFIHPLLQRVLRWDL